MGKRRASSIFQGDDNSDDEDGFMKYLREKTDQSRKKTRDSTIHTRDAQIEISREELSSVDTAHGKETSLGSRYMNQLLESKKRRELDLAHAQSLKLRLEKELGDHPNSVELITEGYKQKKEEYEKADKLMDDEDSKEMIRNPNSILGSENVALKILTANPPSKNHHPSFEGNKSHSESLQTVHYSNDVYVNESLLCKPGMRERLNYADTIKTRERVKRFLQSEKSQQDIGALVKQYWERHNGSEH